MNTSFENLNLKDKLFTTLTYSLSFIFISTITISILIFFNPLWEWFWNLNIFIKLLICLVISPGYTLIPGLIIHMFMYTIAFLTHIFTDLKGFIKNIFYYWIGSFISIFLLNIILLLLAIIFAKFEIRSIAKNFLIASSITSNLKYIFFIFSFIFIARILQLTYKKFDDFCVNCRIFNRPQLFIVCFIAIISGIVFVLNS